MTPIAGHIRFYVDGSCPKPGGPGGWAWVMVDGEDNVCYSGSGGCTETTNNRMELTAAIEGVRALTMHESSRVLAPAGLESTIFIVSDSEYVTKGITDYMPGWERRDFHKVKNLDLWLVLRKLTREAPFPLGWRWVKGHAGNPGNERADKMAGEATAAYKPLEVAAA